MHANNSSCCLRNETSSNGPISYEASALEWFSLILDDDDFFEDSDGDTDTEDEPEPNTVYAKLSAASARVEEKLMSKHIKSGRIKDEHASTDATSSFHRYRFQSMTNENDPGLGPEVNAAIFAAAIVIAQRSIPPPNNTPPHHGHRHRRTNSCPTVELSEMFNSTQITEELHILAPKTRTVEVASEILAARENKAAAA